ncbi:hypothetical protein CCH79_00014457 [Gambusia affinis]|uniref:GATA-type domain-containing protein n=1 Tax=Gambusia affinis TaxID=33528 RepID=A0A315UX09_GAMAF|nr:hypothetical protein CCH79_00014457 [Gambusia affinis]
MSSPLIWMFTNHECFPQKRLKAAEADSKLKQVYIPTYTKPNPNQIMMPGSKPGLNGATGFQKGLSCESCHTAQSPQWYAWGPPNMQCRLCASCWIYWKKYGGLKTPTQLEGAARVGSESGSRSHMTRQEPRRAARRPYASINSNAVKAECMNTHLSRVHTDRCMIRLPKATKSPLKSKVIPRQSLATIVKDLAISAPLKLKASRGPPTPINRNQASQPRVAQSLLGKRGFESATGVPYPANGRPYTSGMRTTSQSVIKRQKVSQGEAPNPVVFVATKDTRALRKHLTQSEMRRAARKPHLLVRIKLPPPPRSLAMPLLPSSTSEPIVLED